MCFALLELVLLCPALPCFCVALLSICFAVLRCALRCVALPFASCLLSFGLICLALPCLALLPIALFAFDEFHSVALCFALLDFAWLSIMLGSLCSTFICFVFAVLLLGFALFCLFWGILGYLGLFWGMLG